MIAIRDWMNELTGKLRQAFADRLLFVGLQGSHRRGEATERSDIDAVVILDRMDARDLDAYRDIVAGMPESAKACGFISGREEIACWPAHDLFQFVRDTEAYYGDLTELAGKVDRADIEAGAKIGAANLYHMLCHSHVHGDDAARMETLAAAYKGSFFILQALHYLRSGEYAASKQELAHKLEGVEREILAASINWDSIAKDGYARSFTSLLDWSKGVVTGF